jgi:hypothetical protein
MFSMLKTMTIKVKIQVLLGIMVRNKVHLEMGQETRFLEVSTTKKVKMMTFYHLRRNHPE